MKRVEITYLDKEIAKANCIGSGVEAKCYKTIDNKVYKLYKDKKIIRKITEKTLFNSDLDNFAALTNFSIQTPEILLMKNDMIVGYTYPYIDGNTLSSINDKIKLLDYFKNYKRLLLDINKISSKGFYVRGIHNNNIILDYNNYYHIIDLDEGCFMMAACSDLLYNSNCHHISRSVINSLFNKDGFDEIFFSDDKLSRLYEKAYYGDIDNVNNLVDYIRFECCGEANPKIASIRKNISVKSKRKNQI